MIKEIKKYMKEAPFPSCQDPEEKTLEYCIAYAQAIYAKHMNNNTGIVYDNIENYELLRLYGNAEQPEEFYKKYWTGEKSDDNPGAGPIITSIDGPGGMEGTPSAKRKSYMNILWDVISTAPKIRSALLGKFSRVEFDMVANAVDPKSGAEQEDEKYELWFLKDNLDFLKEAMQSTGIEMEEPDFIPENREELELYQRRGGFKPEHAKQIEKLVKYTFDVSEWPTIKEQMLSDAIDLGVFGYREVFDEENNRFCFEYCDPKHSVIQYSAYNDFRDSQFAGNFDTTTIGELRKNLARENVRYSETDLENLAKEYSGYQGNPKVEMFDMYNKKDVESFEGDYGYDFYKVCVLHCEWIEIDWDKTLIFKHDEGNKKPITMKWSDPDKNDKNKKTVKNWDRYLYECTWVIGSDTLAYNFGKKHDIIRPEFQSKNIPLSYHFYKLPVKSITAQLRPIYDNFMNLWIKYQGALNQAIARGYAFNVTSLLNMGKKDEGGGASGPQDQLRRFIQTGKMFFKETNAMQTRNSTMKPVYDLPGGMGDLFAEIQAGFKMNIDMTENLTGISPLSVGTVDPSAPVGTSEISYQNTQDTLRPIITGYNTVKQRGASNSCAWIQMKLGDPKVEKVYEPVIGGQGIEVLKIAKKNLVYYGMKLEPQPTDTEKKEVYDAAKMALASRRNGEAGITVSDYFLILNILNSDGSLKLAEMILDDRIRRNEKDADKRAKENLLMKEKLVMQNTALKAKSEKEAKYIDHKYKIEEMYAEAVFKVMVEKADEQMRAKEMLELQTFYNALLKSLDNEMGMQGQGGLPSPAGSSPDLSLNTPQSAIA